MTPVFQTKFGPEEGNCFRSCVASILDVTLEDLPEFTPKDGQNHEWRVILNTWLLERGLSYSEFRYYTFDKSLLPDMGFYIAIGYAPGSDFRHLHAVVHKNQEIVHDPHPDGKGIDGKPVYLGFIRGLDE